MYIKPLDSAIAGKDAKDSIIRTEELSEAFHKAQKGLSTCKNIVLPRNSDQLWIVTDGSVRKQGIAATLYVLKEGNRNVAGFFSAKLRDR